MKDFVDIKFLFFLFFIYPIALLFKPFIKLNPKSICFINPKGGKFLDNNKYIYLTMVNNYNPEFQLYWLIEDKNLFFKLKEQNINVIYYFSIDGFIKFLQSSILIITDLRQWQYGKRLFIKEKKILQLWHGIGFKKIGKLKDENYKIKKNNLVSKKILPSGTPDIFITTSKFYRDEVFAPAYPDTPLINFVIENYPRNDILKNEIKGELIWTDNEVIKIVKNEKKKMKKIFLYVPTFRDKGNNPVTDGALDFYKINLNAIENGYIWVMKFHGMPVTEFNYTINSKYSNILFYDNDKDVYPLLREIDVLITDYSSIYMDFLLLDRPILFYPYDLETYRNKDRGFSHPYNDMTPGKKVFDINELLNYIDNDIWLDNYKLDRKRMRYLGFKYQDFNSCERIVKYLKNWRK